MKSRKGFADLVLLGVICFGIMFMFGDKNSKLTQDYFDRTSSSAQGSEGYYNPNLTYEQFKEQQANGTLPDKGTKMTFKMWSQMTYAEQAEYMKNNK